MKCSLDNSAMSIAFGDTLQLVTILSEQITLIELWLFVIFKSHLDVLPIHWKECILLPKVMIVVNQSNIGSAHHLFILKNKIH